MLFRSRIIRRLDFTKQARIDATYEEGRLLSFISHTALNNITSAYVRGTGTSSTGGAALNVASSSTNGTR